MRALPLLSAGWAWLALALTLTAQTQPALADSPPIKVQLRASWSKITLPSHGSPFLLELLEAARSQRPSSFFPLIDQLTTKYTASQLRDATDEWLARTVEDLIRAHELFGSSGRHTNEALDAWRMSLALQNSSPRIRAFVQLYQTLQLEQTWQARMDGSECVSWVHHGGKVLCSAEQLSRALQEPSSSSSLTGSLQEVTFGHLRSTSNPGNQSFVLYADPFSDNFRDLFSTLEQHASHPNAEVTYTLRWRPSLDTNDTSTSDQTVLLSGYGAILDLKKVDYLVIDDRKLKDDSEVGEVGVSPTSLGEEGEAAKRASDDLRWLQEQIGSDSKSGSLSSLSEAEIADLGIKAAQLIMSSPDPLRAIRELSQNFPLHASALASSTRFDDADTTAALVDAVLGLGSMRLEPGASELWLNGQSTQAKDCMPLPLLDTLRRERKWSAALQHPLAGGGLNVTEASDLISSSLVGRAFLAQTEGKAPAAIFDASDRIELKHAPEGTSQGAITWLNNLEKDEATKTWSNDLMDLLRPMWPGKFPRLSLNLFNVVLVLDLSRRESCQFLSDTVIQSLGRVGLHWGFVPGGLEGGEGTDSVTMARLFWFLLEEASPQILSDVLRKPAAGRSFSPVTIDTSLAVKEAKFALKSIDADGSLVAKLDQVLAGRDPSYAQREAMGKAYIERLRATKAESPSGHVFVNGQHQPFHGQIVQLIHQAVQEQIQALAPQIYYGQISGDLPNLSTFFYDSVGALSFRSALVSGAGGDDEGGVKHGAADLFSALVDGEVPAQASEKVYQFFYPNLAEDGSGALLNSTVWVLADVNSPEGLTLLTRSFEALAQEDAKFRLAVLHIPSTKAGDTLVSSMMYLLLMADYVDHVYPDQMLKALNLAAQPSSEISIEALLNTVGLSRNGEVSKARDAEESKAAHHFWRNLKPVSLRLSITSPAILVDGHLVSHFPNTSSIEPRDITALVDYESAQKLPFISQALTLLRPDLDSSLPPNKRQDLLFATLSVMNGVYVESQAGTGAFSAKPSSRSGLPEQLGTPEHVVEIGDRNTANFRVTVLLDPLSESAQRWSSILGMLSELEGVYVRVILNPKIKLTDLPLKRFYRFSSPHRLDFDSKGKAVSGELRFFDLPEDSVLTLGLDTPAPWLSMPVEAVYDLDNIRLSDIPSASRSKGVKAVYELKHILIEGHAREEQPGLKGQVLVPRGLQLLLETEGGEKKLDTIVMANLAYFQFKAQPGLWKLRIRPGRSDELYEMVSVGSAGWESPEIGITGDTISLDTLSGLTIYPRVAKRAGKETEELLEELDASGRPVKSSLSSTHSSLFSSAKGKVASLLGKQEGAADVGRKHADINIFTVASGHLYERMTYIMILSVLRHTNSSVKFWFIENFLSPSFKEFIPHLAQEYGFEYELVTYAWPHWLRAQTEKQRTIWGYKILFLDTLFPLDLGKVIFVDADQVVRADMKELVDLDLEGKVYGYPPMGDDSHDMDGFRFWKTGYWKDYLHGRPYHISALYVVDLNRFRLFAAGDRLRGQYQALSADPHSLSNLDQDLPNNMQASLPIFTLPKEWLWCETWCSTDWLKDAKTIDLCSNPKTKEPKLERARRQIPEWEVLDREVGRLAQRLVEEKRVGSSVVAPEKVETTKQKQQGEKAVPLRHLHDEL